MKTLFILLILLITFEGKSQNASNVFDSVQFNNNLELANWMVEYDFYTQLCLSKLSNETDISQDEWFSYFENNSWHTVGGSLKENTFHINKHVIVDSSLTISEYTGAVDTSQLHAFGNALSIAEEHFQIVRDTCNMYFSSFVHPNADQSISIWFLPSLQHSGQAIYGCEWEFIFDQKGIHLLKQNAFINVITGVWIGQPRELWLNYRNTNCPTVGSLFFVQSYRDYFTRIRIDALTSISSTSKNSSGKYTWAHKMK
jgi:hypothetical protein